MVVTYQVAVRKGGGGLVHGEVRWLVLSALPFEWDPDSVNYGSTINLSPSVNYGSSQVTPRLGRREVVLQ